MNTFARPTIKHKRGLTCVYLVSYQFLTDEIDTYIFHVLIRIHMCIGSYAVANELHFTTKLNIEQHDGHVLKHMGPDNCNKKVTENPMIIKVDNRASPIYLFYTICVKCLAKDIVEN